MTTLLTRLLIAVNPYNIKANEIGVPTTTGDIGVALTKTTQLVMSLVGGLAVIFLIVGGIQIAASIGDPKRYAQGRSTVLYASIGLGVAIAALAIVNLFAGAIKGGN
ncbi:MAG: hypothetical protein JWN01_1132 [Patescibacteria group bacterium]|nr:hypothetical protein [Patescibacteria group bacterium]